MAATPDRLVRGADAADRGRRAGRRPRCAVRRDGRDAGPGVRARARLHRDVALGRADPRGGGAGARVRTRAASWPFDFRGHGSSGGQSTVGDREVLDVDAAVRWARLLGYRRVATVGFSMGASVVVRHAALLRRRRRRGRGERPGALVLPGDSRRCAGCTTSSSCRRAGCSRAVALRTRIGAARWDPLPEEPRAVAGRIAPTRCWSCTATATATSRSSTPAQLAAAAGPSGELWVEPGFGHAEAAISADLTGRIADWVHAAVGLEVTRAGA